MPESSSTAAPPVTIATPTAWINSTSTRMPMHLYEKLPTVTIATPSAWVNPSASIPTNLGTDHVVITSASVGGLPQVYLGASIAAKAHAAVQANCSKADSPNCQSSVGNAVDTDNALEARVPLLVIGAAAVALLSYVYSQWLLLDETRQAQLVDFQPDGYTQMIEVQQSSSVVFVTASNDPNPVTVPLITTLSGFASTIATGSVYLSTATADGPGYFSGDSFINIPTVDVAPLQSVLAATQSGTLCASPSVHIRNPLRNRGSGDSLINWGGAQVTQLFLSSTGLIAVATVLVIITAVTQNCLVAYGNSFLIPREAFASRSTPSNISIPSSTSAASCAPTEYQPFCINCGGNAGSSKCVGIKTKSYLYSGCPCYEVGVYKYIPNFQQIALAAPTTTPDVDDIAIGNITCQTTTGSPDSGDVDAVVAQLQSWGLTQTCVQSNDYGSHCSTIISNGTAVISVCGTPGATNYCYKIAQ
ncbi:hypothetical protein BDR22DRAFT_969387 [Usnea florida]